MKTLCWGVVRTGRVESELVNPFVAKTWRGLRVAKERAAIYWRVMVKAELEKLVRWEVVS